MTIPYVLAMIIYVVACSATLTAKYGVRWSGITRGFTQSMVFQSLMPAMGISFSATPIGWIVGGVFMALVVTWYSLEIQEKGASLILKSGTTSKEHLLIEAYTTLANMCSMAALVLIGFVISIMVV